MTQSTTPDDLLRTWLKRARESQFAHYAADRRLTMRHYYIGIPAAILSAVVGTSVFASLDKGVEQLPLYVRVGIGLIAVIAAVLTALQTFWRFSERADRHRKTAGAYANVRRKIELWLVFQKGSTAEAAEEIRKEIEAIANEAPSISKQDWDAAVRAADRSYFLAPETEGAEPRQGTDPHLRQVG